MKSSNIRAGDRPRGDRSDSKGTGRRESGSGRVGDDQQKPSSSGSSSSAAIREILSSRYEILGRLGQGKVCTVFRAFDTKLQKEVALEILPPHLAQSHEHVERFHRDAEAAAKLSHPNIAKIFDVGTENGIHYIDVEYLDGMDLHSAIMWTGKVEPDEALRVLTPIAGAIAYAHDKGIVHKDLRSPNIIVTKAGRPVLTDFWIDHTFAATRFASNPRTVGALESMSPEQAQGKEATRSTNIYSFGMILYEALAGKLPFAGGNPFTLVNRIITDPPPPLRAISPIIPPWLEQLVFKCLAKDPSERYPSMAIIVGTLSKVRRAPPAPPPQPPAHAPAPSQEETAKGKPEQAAPEHKKTVIVEEKVPDKAEVTVRKPEPPPPQPVRRERKRRPAQRLARSVIISAAWLVIGAVATIFVMRTSDQTSESFQPPATTGSEVTASPPPLADRTTKPPESRTESPAPQESGTPSRVETKSEDRPAARTAETRKPVQTPPPRPQQKAIAENRTVTPTVSTPPPERVPARPPEVKKTVQMDVLNSMRWVLVEGGTYQMGSKSYEYSKPVHAVRVSEFYMSATEVTFDQYDRYCEATNSKKPGDNGWGKGKMPVVNVSWNDAVAFCQWLSEGTGKKIRLPSEAEYEFAARGGNRSKGYEYSGASNIDAAGWYAGNSGGQPHIVGTKAPNELGIYDLSGNVWEWCQDWFHQSYSKAPADGSSWKVQDQYNPYRVVRGGSANGANYCGQVAFRFFFPPFSRDNVIGFRCVEEKGTASPQTQASVRGGAAQSGR